MIVAKYRVIYFFNQIDNPNDPYFYADSTIRIYLKIKYKIYLPTIKIDSMD